MRAIYKDDPNYREKVAYTERLNQTRLLLFQQVLRLLNETIKTRTYQLLSCSSLDSMDNSIGATREFRFKFIVEELEEKEEE